MPKLSFMQEDNSQKCKSLSKKFLRKLVTSRIAKVKERTQIDTKVVKLISSGECMNCLLNQLNTRETLFQNKITKDSDFRLTVSQDIYLQTNRL